MKTKLVIEINPTDRGLVVSSRYEEPSEGNAMRQGSDACYRPARTLGEAGDFTHEIITDWSAKQSPEPPKPREWILFEMRDGPTCVYPYPFAKALPNAIHVREVLPDEEGKA